MSSLLLMGAGPIGGGGGLSNDTSLSAFTVDGTAVTDGQTVTKDNGTGSVDVSATVTVPGTRKINGSGAANPVTVSGLGIGDNDIDVLVTAQDGVTTAHHHVNVHVLDAGLPEVTTVDFTGLTGANFITAGAGRYVPIHSAGDALNYIWFQTGTETDPAPGGSGFLVPVAALDNDSDLAADVIAAAFGAWPWDITSTNVGAVLTLTDKAVGPRTDATAGTSPVAVTVTQQGRDGI